MAPPVQQARPKSKAWVWLVVLGPILTIIGIIIGSTKSGMCGSVFSSDSLAAEIFDSMGGYGYGSSAEADCRRNIAAAAVASWILIVLGIVLVLTGIIIRSIINNRVSAVVTHAGRRCRIRCRRRSTQGS